MKTKLKTRVALEREILELRGQLACVYSAAYKSLDKASTDHLMASGVLLQLTALGGRELISPILIRDGLSKETIAALKADIKRSLDLATLGEI